MGTIFSSPRYRNPATTATAAATTATTKSAMSETPSENPKNPDQENTSKPPKTPKTLNPNQESSSKPVQDNANPDQDLQKEDEGECPFCTYMKGGGCKETFTNWENCIESAGDEDKVEKCFEATKALAKCMEANKEYYALILQAEKRAEEKVLNKLEQEKAKEAEIAKEGNKEEKVKQETS